MIVAQFNEEITSRESQVSVEMLHEMIKTAQSNISACEEKVEKNIASIAILENQTRNYFAQQVKVEEKKIEFPTDKIMLQVKQMIRGELMSFESRFAEITQIRDGLMDLDSRFGIFMKKTEKDIAELRKACDIETLKLTFCTKAQPDNILKRIADLEKHVNKIDHLQRSVDQC